MWNTKECYRGHGWLYLLQPSYWSFYMVEAWRLLATLLGLPLRKRFHFPNTYYLLDLATAIIEHSVVLHILCIMGWGGRSILKIEYQSPILNSGGSWWGWNVETNLSSKALSKTSRSSSSMIPMCFIMDSKTLPYTKPQLISLILECLNVCVGGMLFLLPSIMLGRIAITSRNWLLDCSENIGLPCSSPQWHHLDF